MSQRQRRFINAVLIDSLANLLLHPHSPAPCAAAETLPLVSLHLHQLDTRNCRQGFPWSVVDAVMAAEVTGVMGGEPLAFYLREVDSFVPQQLADQLHLADHLVAASQLRIFGFDRIAAVMTLGGDRPQR